VEAIEVPGLKDPLASFLEGLQGVERVSQFFVGGRHQVAPAVLTRLQVFCASLLQVYYAAPSQVNNAVHIQVYYAVRLQVYYAETEKTLSFPVCYENAGYWRSAPKSRVD
jgi:hypothetical protein